MQFCDKKSPADLFLKAFSFLEICLLFILVLLVNFHTFPKAYWQWQGYAENSLAMHLCLSSCQPPVWGRDTKTGSTATKAGKQ